MSSAVPGPIREHGLFAPGAEFARVRDGKDARQALRATVLVRARAAFDRRPFEPAAPPTHRCAACAVAEDYLPVAEAEDRLSDSGRIRSSASSSWGTIL